MQLIIVGMHRSGTSVLARLLNLMGVYFAPEGVGTGANQENPKGFWERWDVRALNDFVLHGSGCDWNRVAQFDVANLPAPLLAEFDKRAGQIVLSMDANRPWFIKEPRLCLLLPLWRGQLEMPACIHILRHPVEVAASLQTRNAIPIPAGLALWERYNRDALRGMQGLPSVVVQHRRLMFEPAKVVHELHGQLTAIGVGGLRMPSEAEVQAFVRTELYREREEREDLKRYARAPQVALFRRWSESRATAKDLAADLAATGYKALVGYEQSLPPFQPKSPPLSPQEQQKALLAAKDKELKVENEKRALLESEAEQHRRDRAVMEREISLLNEWASTNANDYARRLADSDAGRIAAIERLAKIEAEKAAVESDLKRRAESEARTAAAIEQARSDLGASEARCSGLSDRIASQEAMMREVDARAAALQGELERIREQAEHQSSEFRDQSTALQAKMQQALTESERRHGQELSAAMEETREAERNLRARFREIAALTRMLAESESAHDASEKSNKDLKAGLERAQSLLRSGEAAFAGRERALGARIAALETQSAQAEDMLSRSVAELTALQSEARRQEVVQAQQLRERDGLLQERSAQLQKVSARLEAVLASASWRWMGPFRKMRAFFGGGSDAAQVPTRDADAAMIRESKWFDTGWYLRQYPDVGAAGADPVLHYLDHGGSEGRDPGPEFSSSGYLQENADVAAAKLNPLVHFLRFGESEGRIAPVSNQGRQG